MSDKADDNLSENEIEDLEFMEPYFRNVVRNYTLMKITQTNVDIEALKIAGLGMTPSTEDLDRDRKLFDEMFPDAPPEVVDEMSSLPAMMATRINRALMNVIFPALESKLGKEALLIDVFKHLHNNEEIGKNLRVLGLDQCMEEEVFTCAKLTCITVACSHRIDGLRVACLDRMKRDLGEELFFPREKAEEWFFDEVKKTYEEEAQKPAQE